MDTKKENQQLSDDTNESTKNQQTDSKTQNVITPDMYAQWYSYYDTKQNKGVYEPENARRTFKPPTKTPSHEDRTSSSSGITKPNHKMSSQLGNTKRTVQGKHGTYVISRKIGRGLDMKKVKESEDRHLYRLNRWKRVSKK